MSFSESTGKSTTLAIRPDQPEPKNEQEQIKVDDTDQRTRAISPPQYDVKPNEGPEIAPIHRNSTGSRTVFSSTVKRMTSGQKHAATKSAVVILRA